MVNMRIQRPSTRNWLTTLNDCEPPQTCISARDSRYSTELNGSKYVILIVRDGWGELYLPGEQQTRQVAYSESLSSAGEPQAFLTDYLEQK